MLRRRSGSIGAPTASAQSRRRVLEGEAPMVAATDFFSVSGRVALVAGGATSLGRICAEALLSARAPFVARWFVLDQSRIDAFAAATEDRQFIHVDPVATQGDAVRRDDRARLPDGGDAGDARVNASVRRERECGRAVDWRGAARASPRTPLRDGARKARCRTAARSSDFAQLLLERLEPLRIPSEIDRHGDIGFAAGSDQLGQTDCGQQAGPEAACEGFADARQHRQSRP